MEVKNAKFWFDFRQESPLTLCDFETEEHVGNLHVVISTLSNDD